MWYIIIKEREMLMPGLHHCADCWYYNENTSTCDAKHGQKVSAGDFACTEFANKEDDD